MCRMMIIFPGEIFKELQIKKEPNELKMSNINSFWIVVIVEKTENTEDSRKNMNFRSISKYARFTKSSEMGRERRNRRKFRLHLITGRKASNA